MESPMSCSSSFLCSAAMVICPFGERRDGGGVVVVVVEVVEVVVEVVVCSQKFDELIRYIICRSPWLACYLN